MTAASDAPKTFMQKVLDGVERVGNKVPHPAVIFIILMGVVIVLSHVLYLMGARVTYEVINPDTHKVEKATTAARSLLTVDGIRFMFTGVVQNFMNFQAVGVIIVAMVGVGVAEASGLVNALIRKLVVVAPPWALTYILVGVGILSSLAADAGYLVLIPLAAAAFISVGRHPLAGLAGAFAAVAGVFLVNVFIVPVDGILTGITNDAIHIVDPTKNISLTANLWFGAASVVIMGIVVALITDKVIEPRLGRYEGEHPVESTEMSAEEIRGLRYTFWGLIGVIVFITLLVAPPGAPLRHPETGAIIGDSPFMQSLIVTIAVLFLVLGTAYGVGAGTIKNTNDIVNAMIKAIQGLGGLIFLLLVISQFLAYFNYTNMTTLAALSLADLLQTMNLNALWLLIGFIIVVFVLDLIITGAIPKWALFAPVFVPLLMRLNVPPDAVLAAYRVGDSPINAITPLNAYFVLIVTFAQQYQKDAGVGTVVALMLPYVLVLMVVWTIFFAFWHLLGLPWGL
jgi:aminobenzoyl-glutamate transport protein